jgi:hypothetical protein
MPNFHVKKINLLFVSREKKILTANKAQPPLWLKRLNGQSHDDFANLNYVPSPKRGRRGRDCVVFGFTTIYAISAYHH